MPGARGGFRAAARADRDALQQRVLRDDGERERLLSDRVEEDLDLVIRVAAYDAFAPLRVADPAALGKRRRCGRRDRRRARDGRGGVSWAASPSRSYDGLR